MRKLVIVEPDNELVSMLAPFLEAQNFEVQTADRREAAWSLIQSAKPDIVLVSRELPIDESDSLGPDGMQLCKQIKQDGALSRIPIIMMSKSASEKDFERYRNFTDLADDYVLKPFEDTDILRRIENLIGFDVSDEIDDIRTQVATVINQGATLPARFDSDTVSGMDLARQQISELMAKVNADLERHEKEMGEEQKLPWEVAPPDENNLEDQAGRISKLEEELARAYKERDTERQNYSDLKKKWKKAIVKIDKKLKETEERERNSRQEIADLRSKLKDLEIAHAAQMEEASGEMRRLIDEAVRMKKRAAIAERLPENFLENLEMAALTINEIVKSLRSE